MSRYLPLILLVFAAGCITQRPITHELSHNNKDYEVDYLFEHDGCKVFRFFDRGNYIYFTTCRGEAIAKTDSTEQRNTTTIH